MTKATTDEAMGISCTPGKSSRNTTTTYGQHRTAAVSYTHLDVYKRQDHVTPGVYRAVRVNLGGLTDLHFPGGDKVVVATYRQLRKIFKFN